MALGARLTGSDMKKFKPEVRKLVALARLLEWDVRWAGNQQHMAVMRSPITPGKTINVPVTSINAKRWQGMVNQITTHSDPNAIKNVVVGHFDLMKEPDIAEIVVFLAPELLDFLAEEMGMDKPSEVAKAAREEFDTVPNTAPMPPTTVAAAMEEAEQVAQQKRSRAALAAVEPEPVPEAPARKIVSERPWLARSGGTAGGQGKVYESQGVMVITYDDGTEAYKCRFCDFTHPTNPRSVKMHAANKKSHDPTHQGIPPKVLLTTDHYEPTEEKRPGRTAIAHLRNDIVLALDSIEGWRDMDSPELADLAAHIIVEARPERNVNTTEMTPEQVLARITMLVDGGRIADLHHQVEQMTAALADATTRANKAEGDIDALREMLGVKP
jgi:hypothetical protein